MTLTVSKLRTTIDGIDDKILALLTERAETCLLVKRAKGTAPMYRPAREAMIIRRVRSHNKGPLPNAALQAIFTEIIAGCRSIQGDLRVSYLGPAGSYSYEAAQQLLGAGVTMVPHATITDAVRAVERQAATVALVPLENSTEGMVVETHQLLLATRLCIVREIHLNIRHCLMAKAMPLSAITQVYAHPQSLGQCRQWLQTHLPHAELIAQPSNSRAAELAAQIPGVAAIASSQAAQLHHLTVLAQSINDNLDNRTRFILLGAQAADPSGSDTTSIICYLENTVGSLERILAVFARQGINLSRIVSQPISRQEYVFYLDFNGHHTDPLVAVALAEVTALAKHIIISGSYPKGDEDERQ